MWQHLKTTFPPSNSISDYQMKWPGPLSEQWFLLSGTENTDGGLIINLNEMQKTPGLYQSKETSTILLLQTVDICFSYCL
jgi:hypothetical protein